MSTLEGRRGPSAAAETRLVYRSLLAGAVLVLHSAPALGLYQGREERLYPDWFLRTPAAATPMAVGYAPVYGDTGLSISEALQYARSSLRIGTAVRVRAEYLQETLPNGSVAYRGEKYAEDTLTAADSVVAVDTVLSGRMLLLMAIPATSRALLHDTRSIAPSRDPPKWVTATPTDASGGAYAVGTASAHYEEHLAWMEAERQARRSLAFAAVTTMRSALHSRTGGSSNGALIASTSTELRGVRVLERWRDERRLFVLVHARQVRPSGS